MNPCAPSPCPDLSSTLSSLNNLLALSNHTLPISPSPGTLNPNLIQCPFNPNHLIPPSSLFLHHLRCPSSPSPIPDPNHLLHKLTYPKTLTTTTTTTTTNSHDPNAPLSFSLDFASNFFYNHCPGVVSFSDSQNINTTFTLPAFLSANFSDSEIHNSNSETLYTPILPSQYWAITRELESWNDFPTTYSNNVLSAISGIGIAKEFDLMNWIIVNSPRFGVVIDTPMQQHIFLLCCLCFKSILREAFVSMEDKQNFQFDGPILNQALTWLASQVSILYGTMNGKFFVLNFVKKCILVGALSLLLFRSQNSDTNGGDIEDAKPDTRREEKANCVLNRKVFVSQVEAAVAALYERSLLEREIKGLWFPQRPSNYQLVAEHCYLSERANEERKKRIDFRPLIDHDGLYRQRSSNQESSGAKTLEELLAEERDYKRRRMSYRGKRIKSSTVQVMREVIEEFMEEIKQAGSVESSVNVSKESGLLPSKPPSGHDIPMEANYSRTANHDSPAVTISNPSYYEKQSHANYRDKSKAVEDVFSRDYEPRRRKHYRSHDYAEDQRNTGRGKYHRDRASTSPERHRSHSRPHEHSVHHKEQDYSNRKKYDHLSGTRDRRQKDSHRNHISDSSPKNAFSDRYVPSESLDNCDDDISSNAKYIKPDKFFDKENH